MPGLGLLAENARDRRAQSYAVWSTKICKNKTEKVDGEVSDLSNVKVDVATGPNKPEENGNLCVLDTLRSC